MPWARLGDTAITHPVVMAASVVSGADTRTRNELVGFVALLATLSAAHLTDSVVEVPAVYMVGGPDTDRLVEQAVECGLMTPHEVDGRQAWKLINDPAFLHIRTRQEVEWDRTRKRDNAHGDLNKEVQRRDGSVCRYCGRTVNWNDRRGTRGGTYDHLDPGQPATTPADKVVCCKGCNSSRGAAHRDGRLTEWDAAHPMRPIPDTPLYDEYLAAQLGVPANLSADAVRPARPDTAPNAERPRPVRDNAAAGERPGHSDTAADADPADPADLADLSRMGPKARSPGTGRDGSGRDGTGRDGTGRSQPARRRRSRRSRHARPDPSTPPPTQQEKRS